jgi:serine protease
VNGAARINPPLLPTLGGTALLVLALILSGVVVLVLTNGERGSGETIPVVPAAPAIIEQVSEPRVAIPDGDQAGVEDVLVVGEAVTVGTIEVQIRIQHPFPSDLTIDLVSPSGTSTVLFSERDRLPRRFHTGNVPELAALAGEPADGIWTLRAYDDEVVDSGTLNAWSIAITPQ